MQIFVYVTTRNKQVRGNCFSMKGEWIKNRFVETTTQAGVRPRMNRLKKKWNSALKTSGT
jgi:hypothetical protein